MKKLIFSRVTVVSDSIGCGGQFELNPGLNLITGDDNSVGKSTLAKLFMWGLGCDPNFDVTWDGFDIRALVEFKIDEACYKSARQGNQMWLGRPDGTWQRFPKITGAYASLFAELVEFKALLPGRADASNLEVPPPAFYFLPFYIDQREGWSKAWSSFAGLEQYKNWQRTIIGYHAGYLGEAHFDLETQMASRIEEKRDADLVVKKIDAAISVVNEFAPPSTRLMAITPEDVDLLTADITGALSQLQERQEELLNKLARLQVDREYFRSQLKLAEVAMTALQQDYEFSVENVSGDSLICPTCGTQHDNSLISRSSILSDRDRAAEVAESLSFSLNDTELKLANAKRDLNETKTQISEIESKCALRINDGEEREDGAISFIEGLASAAVQKKVTRTRSEKLAIIEGISRINRALKKRQRELLPKDVREEMNDEFADQLRKYISKLSAVGVNLSAVNSPTDYKKLYGSGGAAESVRGLLAYYLAVLSMIYAAKNEVAAPFIVDTPNQHEQVNQYYSAILGLLMADVAKHSQLILCAMDRPELQPFKDAAKVIALDGNKLLNPEGYGKYKQELAFLDYI